MFVEPTEALLSRGQWSLNLTFELQALLDKNSPRGETLGAEPEGPFIPKALAHRRFDGLGPVGPRCKQLHTFGVGDEEKRACDLELDDTNCVVLSMGGGE